MRAPRVASVMMPRPPTCTKTITTTPPKVVKVAGKSTVERPVALTALTDTKSASSQEMPSCVEAGSLARALSRANFSVAAGKITGTAAGKDGRFYEACGARPVLDFTSAGYPSTYMLSLEELLGVYDSILGNLRASNPDYIILEIADGIFQRETRMLLESAEFRRSADHVFFAAGDSLSAESGVRLVREYGLPLRATAGSITRSPLASREAEEALNIPCMSIDRIMDGTLKEVLGARQALEWSTRDDVFAPTEEVA